MPLSCKISDLRAGRLSASTCNYWCRLKISLNNIEWERQCACTCLCRPKIAPPKVMSFSSVLGVCAGDLGTIGCCGWGLVASPVLEDALNSSFQEKVPWKILTDGGVPDETSWVPQSSEIACSLPAKPNSSNGNQLLDSLIGLHTTEWKEFCKSTWRLLHQG